MLLVSHLKKHKAFLTGLFFLSLLVRLALFVTFTIKNRNAWIYFDSDQYLAVAKQIASGNGISTVQGAPNFYRLPGYPLFLATCFRLFNTHLYATLLVQLILASLIPILIFLLALILFPTGFLLAKITGLVAAVHLGFVLYAGMIATESLCLLFFLLFLLFFFSPMTKKNMLFAGLFLGIASLIRPIGHYMLLVSFFVLLLQSKGLKATLSSWGALAHAWLLTVSPWLIRNFLLAGGLFFHTLPGLHFLQYSVANVLVDRDSISYVDARRSLLDEWDALVKSQEQERGTLLNEYQRCCIGEKLALKYMASNPLLTIKYSVIQWVKTCLGLYSAQLIIADNNQWHDETTSLTQKLKRFLLPDLKNKFLIPIIYWEIFLLFWLLLGSFCGFIKVVWDYTLINTWLKILPFVGATIFLTLAYGCARLRFPAEPFLIVLGISGWLFLCNQHKDYS